MNNYGGFWIRVLAYIIDAIILAVAGSLIGVLLGIGTLGAGGGLDGASSGADLMLNLIGLVIGIGYFAGMESSSMQATLGKKALGLVVTDLNGNRISFLRGVGRYFATFLSAIVLLIGFIMVAFTDRKQGLHDMLASTLVLKGEPGMVGTDPAVFE